MVVVLPAPFGPRNPVTCPGRTVKERWSTAVLSPYRLVSSLTSITRATVPVRGRGAHRPVGGPRRRRSAPVGCIPWAHAGGGRRAYDPCVDATSTPSPPRRTFGRSRSVLTWIGAALYPFIALLPAVSADRRAPGILPACGSALATVLLVGMIRRRPMAALVMMLLVTALLPPMAKYHGPVWFVPFVAVDITLGYVVATRTLRASVIAVCLTFLTQCLTILGFTSGPDNLVVIGTIALLALVTACVVGLLGRERRRARDGAAVARGGRGDHGRTAADRPRVARPGRAQHRHHRHPGRLSAAGSSRRSRWRRGPP